MFKVGDKVRIKTEIAANGLKHPWFNSIATVKAEPDRLNLVNISIDEFPNCNHREYHNNFYFDIEELELIQEEV